MKSVIFTDPNGETKIILDIECFKRKIIDEFETFWMQGSGDGFIDFYENDRKLSTLIIEPNIKYGLYLHFVDNINHIDLLSLNNEDALDDVVETAEEIFVSIGLFLPLGFAWEAISYFIKTGKTSLKIRWISPEKIPESGNW